ncbi:hypothetical protein B5S32_g3961 [[Candida] boidinii]|nr:hypothetical protein B5S32_g3961 [[Candida] boidinii]
MDVEELFKKTKRNIEEDSTQDSVSKKLKIDKPITNEINDNEELKILEYINNGKDDSKYTGITKLTKKNLNDTLDETANLISINLEERAKFINKPKSYFNSEFQLFNNLKNLSDLIVLFDDVKSLSDYENYLKFFINHNTTVEILNLLVNHPNHDISYQVLVFFNELVEKEDDLVDDEDEEDSNDIDKESRNNVKSECFRHLFFKKCNILNLLNHFIQSVSNYKDKFGNSYSNLTEMITLALNFLINLNDYSDIQVDQFFITAGNIELINWLIESNLSKFQIKNFSSINQYSIEFLSDILIKNEENFNKLDNILINHGGIDIIEIILKILSKFRKINFKTSEIEIKEFYNNLINLINYLLISNFKFLDSFILNEGLQLILITIELNSLNLNNFQLKSNLKILNNCFNFSKLNRKISKIIINDSGLKIIFNLINNNKIKLTHGGNNSDSIKFYCFNLINNFLIHLSTDDNERIRLIHKLINKDFKNLNKIISLKLKLLKSIEESEENENPEPEHEDALIELVNANFNINSIILWVIIDEQVLETYPKEQVIKLLASHDLQVQDIVTEVEDNADLLPANRKSVFLDLVEIATQNYY